MIARTQDWCDQSPYDWTEFVFQFIRQNLLGILASLFQLLPLTATVSLAFSRNNLVSFFDSGSLDNASIFSFSCSKSQGNVFSLGGEILDTTSLCVRIEPQVSPRLFGNAISSTLSFLCGSDKLVVGLHQLLSLVSTVIKPACLSFADHPNRIQERKQLCFQLNHKSTSCSVCGGMLV